MTNKFFNAIVAFILFLPLTFVLSSCSDDDDDVTPVDITGAWYWESSDEWFYMDCNNGVFEGEVGYNDYNYNDDDVYAYIRGSYIVSGNQITFKLISCSNADEFPSYAPGESFTGVYEGDVINCRVEDTVLPLLRDI